RTRLQEPRRSSPQLRAGARDGDAYRAPPASGEEAMSSHVSTSPRRPSAALPDGSKSRASTPEGRSESSSLHLGTHLGAQVRPRVGFVGRRGWIWTFIASWFAPAAMTIAYIVL